MTRIPAQHGIGLRGRDVTGPSAGVAVGPTNARAVDDSTRVALVCGAVVAVLVWLWTFGAPVPYLQRLLGTVIIVVAVLPGAIWYCNRQRKPLPLLHLNALYYAFAFGGSAFYVVNGFAAVNGDEAIYYAEVLTILGLLSQILAYYAMSYLVTGKSSFTFAVAAKSYQLRLLAWGLLVLRVIAAFLPGTLDIPSFTEFIRISTFVGMAILYAQLLLGNLNGVEKLLYLAVALPGEAMVRLATGSLANVWYLGILLGLIHRIVRGRLPFIPIAVMCLFVILLNPVKGIYRERVWFGNDADLPTYKKAELFLTIARDYWSGADKTEAGDALRGTMVGRLGYLNTLAYVSSMTPDFVPYWGGASIENIVVGLVPRIIWKNKPEQTVGNEFGRRYGLLSPRDFSTSYNLPWVVELYANFGFLGVVLGMAAIGVVLWQLERMFSGAPNVMDTVVGAALTFSLVFPESNISLMFGGLVVSVLTFRGLLALARHV
jgi:hypothetical protein